MLNNNDNDITFSLAGKIGEGRASWGAWRWGRGGGVGREGTGRDT